ncbi:MAG: GGDEF domain-containing protein [Burkholderiales bacterium]|nr:GGDEF domain-containing protein [Burkholderiales bacterium]
MKQSPSTVMPAQAEFELQRRGLIDASKRVKNGAFIYVVLWVIACQSGDFHSRHSAFVVWNAIGLLALGVARFSLNHYLPRVTPQTLKSARAAFRIATAGHAFYFGVLTIISLLWPEAATMSSFVTLIAATMTIGGTMIVAIDPFLALAYPIALMGPVIVGLLTHYTPSNGVLGLLATVFSVYCILVSRAMHDDYWLGQRSRVLLEQRARQLEVLSLTDPLTQIPNRLFFEQRLAMEWATARRANLPLAVAIIDLDHFKSINDNHGHPFGDQCLKLAAEAFQTVLMRTNDEVARYGGEEFAVLLPQASLEGAMSVAQRLLESVHSVVAEHDGMVVPMTCSIGVCSIMPAPNMSPDDLIKRADQALYQAKLQGRNQVVGDAT